MKKTKRNKLKYSRLIGFVLTLILIISGVTIGIAKTLENTNNKPDKPKEETGQKQEETPPVKEPVEESGKIVYLTFDDGPWKSTPQLLDVLDKHNVKATFFVTAQYLEEKELLRSLKDISDRGHEVAVHTYSHEYDSIYSSVEAYMEDYKKMDDLIFQATGKRSKLFRFPGGSNTGYNTRIRDDLINAMENKGLIYHDWNAYDGDCDGYQGQALINRAVTESSYTDKSIVLMHDTPGKETVVESLPSIIQQLKDNGYQFRALHEKVKPFQFS